MAEAMIAVEDKIRLGYNDAYIANSREHIMTGCSYVNYSFGDYKDCYKDWFDAIPTVALNGAAFGTFNAADAGNVIHYSYDKSTGKITMRCKYYLLDYYDYEKIDLLRVQDAAGCAKSFELFGVCEAEYTWTKGKCDLTGGIIK